MKNRQIFENFSKFEKFIKNRQKWLPDACGAQNLMQNANILAKIGAP